MYNNENVIAKIDVSESLKLAKGEYKWIKIFKLFNPNEDELLSKLGKVGYSSIFWDNQIKFSDGSKIERQIPIE